jgi:hypothetical protein
LHELIAVELAVGSDTVFLRIEAHRCVGANGRAGAGDCGHSEGQRGASGAQQAGRVLTGNVAHILTQLRQECAARNAANDAGS